jgi:3-oxoacyl-[acyl-carrier-protein] synthase III
MGTIINSLAIESSKGGDEIVQLISNTAKSCLCCAGLGINSIGMLISTGVYSENHLKEPALATLVHKQLLEKNGLSKTFSEKLGELLSFDIHNGGGGIINAIQVIDGFMQSDEIENGLIVSGDVKPITGITNNYNLETSTAAILLSKNRDKKGFVKFKTESFSEFKNDFFSSTNWDNGSLVLINKQSHDYLKKTVNCVVKVIRRFFEEEHLSWNEIDFVCTSQSPKGFSFELKNRLNLKEKIIQLNEEGEIYSSGLLFAVNQIFSSKEFSQAKNLLFVTVGAGITVSLAYYKNHK